MKVLTKFFFLLAFICFLGLNLYAQENAFVIEEFKKAIDSEANVVRKIQLLHDYSKKLRQINPDVALEYASASLQLSNESDRNELISLSLINQGNAYAALGQNEKAVDVFQQAIDVSQSASLQDIGFRATIQLGRVYINTNLKTAYDLLARVKNQAEQADNKAQLADAYAALGDWFLAQNEDNEEPLNKYFQAVELYKELELQDEYALLLNQIGQVYLKENDPNKALLYFIEAYRSGQNINDKLLITNTLNEIGGIYISSKSDFNSALKYYRECYRISKTYNFLNNGKTLSIALQGIMNCYEHLAKYNAQINNKFKADEYDNIYRTYQEIFYQLREASYNVAALRDGRANTPTNNDPNAPRNYTFASPLNDDGTFIETNDESLLEEQRVDADRDKIIEELSASGELQKDTLKLLDANTSNAENNNTVVQENTNQLPYAPKQQNLWLIGVVLVVMMVLTSYALFRLHNREKLIARQKQKLEAYNERINRQEVVLREKENTSNKKDIELAESYNKLDDALLEKSALTQILDEEVKPPLARILEKSQEEKVNPLIINQSAKYALNLISSIVDIQNLEKEQLMLNIDNYSVYKVSRNAISQFSEIIKEKGITLQNNIKPFYYAEFDEAIIERVFLCLIENALKYTSPEGVITLDAWQQQRDQKQFISVSLNDDGQRIPSNALSFVYNKYSPEEARPSGLGMAYVKMAIEAHQGSVEVHSTPQEGTSFVFMLPESKVNPSTHQSANTAPGTVPLEAFPELNDSERDLLRPFVDQLSGQKIYETSVLYGKLAQIQVNAHENVDLWVKQVKEAIFNLNEDKFHKLLDLV